MVPESLLHLWAFLLWYCIHLPTVPPTQSNGMTHHHNRLHLKPYENTQSISSYLQWVDTVSHTCTVWYRTTQTTTSQIKQTHHKGGVWSRDAYSVSPTVFSVQSGHQLQTAEWHVFQDNCPHWMLKHRSANNNTLCIVVSIVKAIQHDWISGASVLSFHRHKNILTTYSNPSSPHLTVKCCTSHRHPIPSWLFQKHIIWFPAHKGKVNLNQFFIFGEFVFLLQAKGFC